MKGDVSAFEKLTMRKRASIHTSHLQNSRPPGFCCRDSFLLPVFIIFNWHHTNDAKIYGLLMALYVLVSSKCEENPQNKKLVFGFRVSLTCEEKVKNT
ncbi:hypothetical protein MRB53_001067 [Persea americana]|uniref:Uncharacterized protein n=1 Tax=Persea americana TaxID=3435 RepID=A0ACC2MRN4_PERAE|nr:hypothetical protein MRB53_001067 [Persea americana]